jgi:hypothetical protein
LLEYGWFAQAYLGADLDARNLSMLGSLIKINGHLNKINANYKNNNVIIYANFNVYILREPHRWRTG